MNGRLSQSFTNEENGGTRRSAVCVAAWISSVQSLSHVQLFATPWTAARPPCPPPTPGAYSNTCPLHQWCHPTISSSVVPFSSFNLSQIRVFSNESVLRIRWPKYWSFSFSISPSNEYSGLISFRTDWLDLLAVQGSAPTPQLKTINSVVLSFVYSPTLTSIHDYWKNHSLTRQTFAGKVMSLLFNMLSRLVMTFLPRSKRLLLPSSNRVFYIFFLYFKVAQSCLTLCNPMDYTVHGILQARILEWVAFPFSRGFSQPRDRTQVSCITGGFFTNWAIRKAKNLALVVCFLLPLKRERKMSDTCSLHLETSNLPACYPLIPRFSFRRIMLPRERGFVFIP